MTSSIDVRPACGRRAAVRFIYLSLGQVRGCEIEISHMGKTTEIPIWCARKDRFKQFIEYILSQTDAADRKSELIESDEYSIYMESKIRRICRFTCVSSQ